MKRKSRIRRSLPSLSAAKTPKPLPEQAIKEFKRWFNRNIPSNILDCQNRVVVIGDRDTTFGHLISSTETKTSKRKHNINKARLLNLIVPCLQNPLEVYRSGKSIIYISLWKPEKGKRFVVICKREGSELRLKTMFNMEDSTVEKRRQNWDMLDFGA